MPTNTLSARVAAKASTARPHGFVTMFKQSYAPWRFINVLRNGMPPQSDDKLLQVLQALVGGYIESIGRPTERLPYGLVCNEEGHLRSFSRNVDLRGGLSLVGPVVFVRYEHGEDGWSPVSMDLRKGGEPHVKTLRRLLGVPLHPDDIVVDHILTMDVIDAPVAKEAVHA